MKKTKRLYSLAALGLALCLLPLSACGKGKCTAIAEPASTKQVTMEERNDEAFHAFKQQTERFAAKFTNAVVHEANTIEKNLAVSPFSVFSALAMATECANGDTRTELLSALGVTQEQLQTHYSTLFSMTEAEYKQRNAIGIKKTQAMTKPANSIWLQEGIAFDQDCFDLLAKKYYCHSFTADFKSDNDEANKALSHFIKKQTKGLIKKDYHLSEETFFTLVASLYLKDVWNTYGNDLPFHNAPHTFTNGAGKQSSVRLLQGYYSLGRAYETEKYSYFFTNTHHNYHIRFILPKDGYTLADVFTEDTLNEVASVTDFQPLDEENLLRYSTRCLFPEFSADYDEDVKDILENTFGVSSLFDLDTCDLSAAIGDSEAYCGGVLHTTDLKVNRKGIEGAATTIQPFAGAPGPDDYQDVYVDFVVDRAFGFVITDNYDTTLFAGVVNTL